MACAYAKYTGKLGACLTTFGPGAIHLLNGLYDAKADNTPVIAITGTTYSVVNEVAASFARGQLFRVA
jgi:pyruvate dehydrogenase (quinone)